jgi:hypothetical protein
VDRKEGEVAALELLMKLPGRGDSRSPFDEALGRVAKGSAVDLACPYLSVDVLARLLGAGGRFRLVTDAEEWLRALARPGRAGIIDFIRAHQGAVRHYRDLHAKVALSPTLAMLGSANFTERGLLERQEIGVLLRERATISQLAGWYEALWSHAHPVDLDALADFERALPAQPLSEHAAIARTLAPPPAHVPPGTALPLPEEGDDWDHDTVERLIAFLGRAPSRPWAEHFLEAARILVEGLGVQPGDPRVVTSFRKHGFIIAVSINNRWVLQPWHNTAGTHGRMGVGILQQAATVEASGHVGSDVVDSYQYDPRPEDTDAPPWMLAFADFAWLGDARYVTEWLLACHEELYKARGASNAASHSRVLFRAITDLAYRQHVVARVNWPAD